jgi:uncharacterized protein YraI
MNKKSELEMMKMRIWSTCLLLIVLVFTACAAPSNAPPTPTIVRLNRTPEAETPAAEIEPTEEVPSPTPATPETTAITATATRPPEPAATSEPTAAPAAPVQAEVITYGLNVRSGPGMDYQSIGTVARGTVLEVIDVSANGNWLQVITPDGGRGWVSSQPAYTRITGSLDELRATEAPASSSPPASNQTAPTQTPALQNSGAGESQPDVANQPQPVAAAGDRLVFATRSGGDLYVINLDGTGLRHLASGVIDPAVSPDGRQVAFTRWDPSEFGTLYVMNLDGSGERAILGETRQAKSPTWSPDGQEIILSFQHGGLRDPQQECRRYDFGDEVRLPEGARITRMTRIGEKDTLEICFIPREDLQWSLRRVDLATGQYQDLPADLYSFSPAWNPSQAWQLLYNTDKGLMRLDVNSGQKQPVSDDVRDNAPVFSPDGQRLALSYQQHDHWEVYTYDLASGARQRLTKPPLLADPQYSSAAPAWSPDGSRIAFVTNRTGQWEIWVMNGDGSNPQPLFPSEVQAEWALDYQGVNERLLNWVGSAAPAAANTAAQAQPAPAAATRPSSGASLSGDWQFSFGAMTLTQRDMNIDGAYQWYGGVDTGRIEGVVVDDLDQFRGMWISDRSPNSQKLLRWRLADDRNSFSGGAVGGSTDQQWCGVRAGQPLPAGCGFSGVWQLRFGNPPGVTGQANLVQTGPTVQGSYTTSEGHSGEIIDGLVSVQSTTEIILSGTWRNDQGQQDSFEWRLDLTTGQSFQGRRDPGNSEWCGWRPGADEPEACGWRS